MNVIFLYKRGCLFVLCVWVDGWVVCVYVCVIRTIKITQEGLNF